MYPLKQQLAEYGFESREDYDYAVQCLLNSHTENIRCLNVDGDPGRRKTAFAHALAQVMDVGHVLYYEFGTEKTLSQIVRVVDGEDVSEEPPTQPFDRVMTEASTLSEAEKTILILDQLQLAPFQQHIRLYEFIKSKQWSYSDVSFYANSANLLIFIISSEPLYHSLQQISFRIWVGAQAESMDKLQPDELGLDEGCREWLEALSALLFELGCTPSISECQKLTYDIERYVRTEEQLRISIFGWIENIDRKRLNSRPVAVYVRKVMTAVEDNLSIQEEIELSSEESD
jgi:hypothetical protein